MEEDLMMDLSVHFLKVEDKFYVVDGLESFEDLLKVRNSIKGL